MRGLRLEPLTEVHTSAWLDLVLRNRGVIEKMEPSRPEEWWTEEMQRARLQDLERLAVSGRRLSIAIMTEDTMAGYISLDNIVRGAWQNATLGYLVDHRLWGKGIGTGSVRGAVDLAFSQQGLHRVQAAVIPGNTPSVRVLEKNRFRLEGRALRYLEIGGRWQDHDIYAITAEEWA